jgi:putative ABC transport system ATP-binding protein
VIVRQGDVGEKFYFIRNGKVEVQFELPNRPPRKLTELGKGEYFGDRALITSEPRNATVRAVEDTVTYTVARQVVEEARTESIPFINRILEVYGRTGAIAPEPK